MSKTSLESHFALFSSEINENLSFGPYMGALVAGMLGKELTVYEKLYFRVSRRINRSLFEPLDRKYNNV